MADEKWLATAKQLRETVTTLTAQVHHAEITCEEDAAKCADFVKLCTNLEKKIEEQRKEFVGPIRAVLDELNADAKALAAPLAKAKERLQGMLTVWLRKKQAEAEEAARIEREKKEAQALEHASMLSDAGFKEDADTVLEKAATGSQVAKGVKKASGVRSDWGATTSLRKRLVWDVVEIEQVPAALIQVNGPAVTTMIANVRGVLNVAADEKQLRGQARDAWIDDMLLRELGKTPGLTFRFETDAQVR